MRFIGEPVIGAGVDHLSPGAQHRQHGDQRFLPIGNVLNDVVTKDEIEGSMRPPGLSAPAGISSTLRFTTAKCSTNGILARREHLVTADGRFQRDDVVTLALQKGTEEADARANLEHPLLPVQSSLHQGECRVGLIDEGLQGTRQFRRG